MRRVRIPLWAIAVATLAAQAAVLGAGLRWLR